METTPHVQLYVLKRKKEKKPLKAVVFEVEEVLLKDNF